MLVQYYTEGDYSIKDGTLYYQGVRISPVNPTPVWDVGNSELYIMPARFPLKCAWLVVIQSRFPIFYRCSRVEMESEKVTLYETNGRKVVIRPFRDGVHDQLLVNSF